MGGHQVWRGFGQSLFDNHKVLTHDGRLVPEELYFCSRDATEPQKTACSVMEGIALDEYPILHLTKREANTILRKHGFASWGEVGAL